MAAPPPFPAASHPAPEVREVPLRFDGQTSEYFRIWIVNLALTLVTVGIYSAWAKVRTRQYFYGNTRLDGSPFEYTADPVRILIGRLLVGGFGAAYAFAANAAPTYALAFAGLLFLATPWIAVRALSFNHRNTRWRNLRFAFRGSYGDAARAYLGWALLSAVSLGILVPVAHGKRHEFMVKNSRYGAEPFSFAWRPRDYYGPYIAAFFIVILGFVLAFVAVALSAQTQAEAQGGKVEPSPATALLLMLPWLLAYAAAYVVVSAGTTNLLYGGAQLAGHRFRSTLRSGELLWLYFTSALAIAATFGALIPWAQIRLARYRASKLTLLAAGDLESFVAATEEAEKLDAVADEAAVAFDFDFGL